MPYYSPDLIQQIAEANDIVEIISQFVPLKKRGSNYIACCPFHNEKTPSFTVNPQKKYFYCFGCHEKGDIYTFLEKKENMTFSEAVKYLANRASIPLPSENSQKDLEKVKENQQIYNLNAKAGNYFYRNLKNSKKALGYLVDRQINAQTVREFGLGYSKEDWSDLNHYLLESDEKAELIEKAGLVRKSKNNRTYDLFRDRLIIPIQNVYGKVIAFGGRKLDDDNPGPKYLNSPDTPVFNKRNQLFNLNRAKSLIRENPLILVEGYMDVIALYSYGIKNVAAALGTAFTQDHAKLISRYTSTVILCFDGDAAGEKATSRALDILSDSKLKINIIRLPVEHDPDTYIRENGLEAFKEEIKHAQPANDYRLDCIQKKFNLEESTDLIDYVDECCRFIQKLNPVEKEIYIKKVAEISHLEYETIKQQLQSQKVQSIPKVISKPVKKETQTKQVRIPRELLEAQNIFLVHCYQNPNFIEESECNEFMLVGNFYKWFFVRLKDIYKKEPELSELIQDESDQIYEDSLQRFLLKVKKINQSTVNHAVDVIKKYNRQREIARLEADLNDKDILNKQNLFDQILDLRKADLN